MTATKDEISDWFDRGVAQKATHMIVVCDTYGHEDYPCFANSDADAIELHSYYDGKNMQGVMEVYDLRANKTEQMNEHRAMRLPETPNAALRGDSGLIAGVPLESTVRTQGDE